MEGISCYNKSPLIRKVDAEMSIKIALAGNPNSGKTTLFNHLTGSSQYVGNWPGVTVEKKEGRLHSFDNAVISDLPGIYSLSPYSLEEVVTRDYLLNGRPDVILNIVDASNLERNLYLTTQLMETGIPMVIALNMMDVVEKKGDHLDIETLSAYLGCPVIATSAVKGKGAGEAAKCALKQSKFRPPTPIKFSPALEEALSEIQSLALKYIKDQRLLRWYAIKLFERDKNVQNQLRLPEQIKAMIEHIIKICEAVMGDSSESIVIGERYAYIEKVVNKSLRKNPRHSSLTGKIDKIATNRFLAFPVFAAVIFTVYFISVSTVGTYLTDWTTDIFFGKWVSGAAKTILENTGAAQWLVNLITEGIIGGVGAVLGFVPQMALLFLLLSFLEDCGYMARVAFIMDRVFRSFGLSGKSFIPILVASGCGVPGIMASRTIEDENKRKMTIMVTTFIPCGAKLPLIALISGAVFPEGSWWVAPSIYFLGILMIFLSALILSKTRLFKGDATPFVIELPDYHLPSPKVLFLQAWKRIRAFIVKAGTVIFIASGVIWFFGNFSFNLDLSRENSILSHFGHILSPLFSPLGFGDWRAAVSAVAGLAAKENIVSTLNILLNAEDAGAEFAEAVSKVFNPVSGYSYAVFNILCAPCVAAIGAIHREMGSLKWTLIATGYQTLLAYSVSFVIYQIGRVVVLGATFNIFTFLAIAVALLILWLIIKPAENQTPAHIKRPAKNAS